MKKQVFLRALGGIPIGITIGVIIASVVSFIINDGTYYPCVPSLIDSVGSELKAVILQHVLCALLGGAFSAASVVWELDNWSIARQTGVYFLVMSVVMMPIAYLAHWMEHSFIGFVEYFAVYVVIFIIVWLVRGLSIHSKLKRMNQKIQQNCETE